MNCTFLLSILLLNALISCVYGQGLPCLSSDNEPVTSCSKCLARPECSWCPHQPTGSQPAVGCIRKGSFQCPVPEITSSPELSVQEARPLSQEDSVQLSPQAVNLVLSPNADAKVDFQVSLADIPVDIYFVMDLSNSMRIHQTNLVNAAGMIAEKVTELTSDYRLGFGSFSDKPTPPFSSELSFYQKARQEKFFFIRNFHDFPQIIGSQFHLLSFSISLFFCLSLALALSLPLFSLFHLSLLYVILTVRRNNSTSR